MTMKDLKATASKLGIVCSGLRSEYVKKLVIHELNQRVHEILLYKIGYQTNPTNFSHSSSSHSKFSRYFRYQCLM